MKNKINIFLITFASFAFVSCSNMTIGLEEDSRFYNGPLIDTRADSETAEVKKTESEPIIEEKKTQDKVVVPVKQVQSVETSALTKEEEPQSQENETTFSYERDDD